MRDLRTDVDLDLLADNVLPTRRREAPAWRIPLGDLTAPLLLLNPEFVDTDKAAGGFSSVVQVDSNHCLRLFSDAVSGPLGGLRVVTPEVLRQFLADQASALVSAELRTYHVSGLDQAVGVVFEPRSLRFSDPRRVHVEFAGQLGLYVFRRIPEVPDLKRPPWEELIPDDPGWLGAPGGGGPPGPDWGRGANPFAGNEGRAGSSDLVGSAGLYRQLASVGVLDLVTASLLQSPGESWVLDQAIGEITFELTCEYAGDVDTALKRVDVYALMGGAQTQLTVPTGDARLFYDRFLAVAEEQLTQVPAPSRVHLTPTVSPFGRDPANASTEELEDFEARVFHVRDHKPQAMTIAFDLMPGCQGYVEDVRYFLAGRDYGVISDEWTLQRVFKHKWRLGGFARTMRLDQATEVQRGERVESARLEGTLTLDTLDVVAIETDADTRTDYVRIGGTATAQAERIRFGDGTVVGPDQVDFGPPQGAPWTLFTDPAVQPRWSADPQLRLFQVRAHQDAYRHAGRPFARLPNWGVDVEYARTEGVLKQVYFLGNLTGVFV